MGIKKWLFVGGAAILMVAVLLGYRKKEELCAEKADCIIKSVDEKVEKECEEVQSLDELSQAVDSALKEMDISGDDTM